MSRPLRIDYPGTWHHVMNRARLGYELFHDKDDYELFLFLLHEASAMFHLNVAVYMARHLKGERLTKIGKAFNLNRDSSVSSAIERVRKRIETDKAFQKRVNRIKEKFYKGHTKT